MFLRFFNFCNGYVFAWNEDVNSSICRKKSGLAAVFFARNYNGKELEYIFDKVRCNE